MTNLEQTIVAYQQRGWVLLSQTGTSAQLSKPKSDPDCLFTAILFLLGILPGILYLLLHIAKKEETVLLVVNAQGLIQAKFEETGSSGGLALGMLIGLVILVVLFVFACIFIVVQIGSGSASAILSVI